MSRQWWQGPFYGQRGRRSDQLPLGLAPAQLIESKQGLPPGTKVWAKYRWSPDTGRYHTGTVLAVDDPSAWEGSIAFGGRRPTRQEVREHIANPHVSSAITRVSTPVRWSFGKTFWDRTVELQQGPPPTRAPGRRAATPGFSSFEELVAFARSIPKTPHWKIQWKRVETGFARLFTERRYRTGYVRFVEPKKPKAGDWGDVLVTLPSQPHGEARPTDPKFLFLRTRWTRGRYGGPGISRVYTGFGLILNNGRRVYVGKAPAGAPWSGWYLASDAAESARGDFKRTVQQVVGD